MKLPWVSRALYDAAQQQIADLKEANAKLFELMSMKQEIPASKPEDVPEAPRPHRKLAAQIRSEFAEEAAERARKQGVTK